MKSASAILKKGTVFLRAFAQTTTTGLWIGHGRVYATPIGEP
ncbi:hypothetical protein [Aquisalinus luteolus]|uniref:Uncharacterized protein n=1 Tax=Aquisalinus luteolus TaxID=1566827 RepID=A0A8J3A9J5_9PROT|nr:hypothetical protein [Aquisalinus luteolus]GGI00322.1 hypothetical protein GCM10011355_28340 [Aquisalinus luteolus]